MANRRAGSVKPERTVAVLDSAGKPVLDQQGRPKQKPASGTKWYFVVDVDSRGKRRQIRRRGFETKGAAQEALDAMKGADRRHEVVNFSRMTYGEWLVKQWLPTLRQQVAEGNRERSEDTIEVTTFRRYASDVRLHILPHDIADRRLQDLDELDLNSHWALLRNKPRRGRDGAPPLSARTVQMVSITIQKSLKDAVAWKQRVGNPCDAAKMPREGRRKQPRSWDAATLAAFLEWDRTFIPLARRAGSDGLPDRMHALWWVIAHTGMRRGEALALDWDGDVHIDDDCSCDPVVAGPHLVISDQIRHVTEEELDESSGVVRDYWEWAEPKTDAGFRTIGIDDGTVTVLREWKAQQAAERLALGAGWKGAIGRDGKTIVSLVFSHPDGTVIHPRVVTDTFERRTRRFGHFLNIHGLRHTWATLALEAGVHPSVVQARFGHSRVETTLNIYTQVRSDVDAQAGQDVADYIKNAPLPGTGPKRQQGQRKAVGDNVTHLRGRGRRSR